MNKSNQHDTALTLAQLNFITRINALASENNYAGVIGFTTKRIEAEFCIQALGALLAIAELDRLEPNVRLIQERVIFDSYIDIMHKLGYSADKARSLLSAEQTASIEQKLTNILTMFNASTITVEKFKDYDNLDRQYLLDSANKVLWTYKVFDESTFDLYIHSKQLLSAVQYINRASGKAPLLYKLRIKNDLTNLFKDKITIDLATAFSFTDAQLRLEGIINIFENVLAVTSLTWSVVQDYGLEKFQLLTHNQAKFKELLSVSNNGISSLLPFNIHSFCILLKSAPWIVANCKALDAKLDQFLDLSSDKIIYLATDQQRLPALVRAMEKNQWHIADVQEMSQLEFMVAANATCGVAKVRPH